MGEKIVDPAAPAATLIDEPVVPEPGAAGGAAGGKPPAKTPEEIAAAEKVIADKVISDKAAYDALTPEEKVIADKKIADDKVANTIPETYTDFTLPEGMTLNKEVAEKFASLAKELKLTQGNAQKLVDLQSSMVQEQTKASMAEYAEIVAGWKKETIAALGVDSQKRLGVVSKALTQFGSPELRKVLSETGLGNQKDLIMFFANVGDAISEDSFVDGKFKVAKPKDDGSLFYPNMNKK